MALTLLHQVRIASGLNIICGLWLIVSPYGFGYYLINPPFWNSVVVGMVVSFFAILRLVMPFRFPEFGWINVFFGAWLVVSPFLFRFAHIEPVLWNSVIVGLFLMAMAVWSLVSGRRGENLIG